MSVEPDAVGALLLDLGIEQAVPDEQGTWSLKVGEDLLLLLRITPDRAALLLSAPIGMLEVEPSRDRLREMLEATTYWLAHAAVVPGLVPGGSTILLSTRLEPEWLVPERFLERVQQLVGLAEAWREQMAAPAADTEESIARSPSDRVPPGDDGGFHDFA